MKAKKILVTAIIILNTSIPCLAQFNTVSRTTAKHIDTNYPSEQQETIPKDSIYESDSLDSNNIIGEGNVELPDSMFQAHDILEQYLSVSYPLKTIHIGSGFGMRRHPVMHKYCMYNGVDLQARYEEVYSMFPGTVIKVGQNGRSGKFVTIQSSNYTISYCHLSQQLVQTGMFVKAGDVIAKSGNTGMSTGPHLHLTTKKDGKAFNPTILLDYIEKFRRRCMSFLSR